jgi:hypothetical protein
MSDVGGVLVDKDAVYIDVKTNTFDRDSDEDFVVLRVIEGLAATEKTNTLISLT